MHVNNESTHCDRQKILFRKLFEPNIFTDASTQTPEFQIQLQFASFSIMSRFITGDELGNIKILECCPDTDPSTSEWKFNERILDAPILGNANSSSIEVEKARKAAINRLSITDNNDSLMVCHFSKYIQPGAHGIISRKACCLPFERDMFCLHSKQRR